MTHWGSSYIFSFALTANVTNFATRPTPNLSLCAAIDLVESRSVFKPLTSRVVNLHWIPRNKKTKIDAKLPTIFQDYHHSVCLFDLILYVHSTIFQLCGTGLPGLNEY